MFVFFLSALFAQELPGSLTDELQKAEQAGDTRFVGEFFNMILYLGLLLVLMTFLLWVVKRMTATRLEQTNRASSIKVLERRTLTPKTTIYILQILDKEIAIADSHNGVTKLSEIPYEEEPEKPTERFENYLKNPK